METRTTLENAKVTLDGYRINRYRLIGSKCLVYDAWAPLPSMVGAPYATITREDDQWWGRLGTERDLPAEIEALPSRTLARYEAVTAWYEANYQLSTP